MDEIDELINRIVDFEKNINEYIRLEIIDNEAIISDMNSQSQLFEKGITRDGIEISSYAPYSPRTVAIKMLNNKPTNRVTLRDTGEFHASFVIIADDTKFFIDATDWKTDRLGEKYGEQIFGLTDENVNELIWEYIYPMLLNKLKEI